MRYDPGRDTDAGGVVRVSGNGGKGQAKKEVAVEAVGEALRGDLGEGPKRAVEGFVKGNVDTVDTRCAYMVTFRGSAPLLSIFCVFLVFFE